MVTLDGVALPLKWTAPDSIQYAFPTKYLCLVLTIEERITQGEKYEQVKVTYKNTGRIIDVNNAEILKDSWGKGNLFKTSVHFETPFEYQLATTIGVPTQVMLTTGLFLGIVGAQILGKGSGTATTVLLII